MRKFVGKKLPVNFRSLVDFALTGFPASSIVFPASDDRHPRSRLGAGRPALSSISSRKSPTLSGAM